MNVVNRFVVPGGMGREAKALLRRMAGAGLLLMSVVFLLALIFYSLVPSLFDRVEFGSSPVSGGEAVSATVVYGTLSVATWLIGVRWLRGRRRLVLFLRRFGLTEPTRALTEALVDRLGRDWRMLTLDDEHVVPVGVSSRMVNVARIGRRVAAAGLAVGLVCGIVVVWIESTNVGEEDGVVEPSQLLESLFADLVVGAMGLAALVLAALVGVSSWLLLVHNRAVHRAERSQAVLIVNEVTLRRAIKRAVRLSRRVFAPRLTVARVRSDMWREAVSRLWGSAETVLVDVSEPSENLLWELRALEQQGVGWLAIGSVERLQRVQRGTTPIETECLALLGERPVLGYRLHHLEPFASALGEALSALPARRSTGRG